uniref:Uncharacterized protein n=1 Tax=Caenorhabditis japonica TaxID=281687 RepID=A0A8R1IDJ4_CAEJA
MDGRENFPAHFFNFLRCHVCDMRKCVIMKQLSGRRNPLLDDEDLHRHDQVDVGRDSQWPSDAIRGVQNKGDLY